MKKIIKYFILVAFTFFTAIYVFHQHEIIGNTYSIAIRDYCLIILITIILYLIILRRRLVFFENLLHELTHVLFSMLTFKKISGFYVSATSGAVYTEGSRKSMLVTLSPYFFPLLTVSFLVLFSLIRFEYSGQIIIASYCLSIMISFKHLLKDPGEILSTGPSGFLLLVMLNFWTSYLLLLWLTVGDFNLIEILTTTSDGFKRIISQLKLV